jgi:heat shock protein HslJ
MLPAPASLLGRWRLRHAALAAGLMICYAASDVPGPTPAVAAERGFPYNSELMLDARPMRGSRRVPMLVIGAQGQTSIEGWCNTVKAQMVVAADTVTILTGTKTDQQCAAERMRGDDELLAALTEVTNWRRDGDVLTLRGTKTLRFRTMTN